MFDVRTDLAVEAREKCRKERGGEVPGVEVEETMEDGIKVTCVKIVEDIGEKIMGKPKGSYITVDMPRLTHYDGEIRDKVSKVVGKVLSSVIDIDKSMTALVVGLGNWNITPDSLGPKVVSKLMVTRHLKQLVPDKIDEGIRPVCVISPGVLGITGIETSEIIQGVVDKVKPNLIICIDSLASRKMDRVNYTVQIGNRGISPGSGVGNRRMELSEKTLGVPVIAIGVPTVVDAATMANDTIDMVLDEMIRQTKKGEKFYEMLKSVDKDEKHQMIRALLEPYKENIMVTPKDVDLVVDSISKVIANAINIALQPALDLDDINTFLN
ncbi:GPR endopeptidase [Clostridium sp. MT-14]|uniref:Germination protease n=1 Tax=Clostridium aromativorans TaxID=2836848 RepID=A0ABS8N4W9_9CLOT|nr:MULTISPECIES: GPR endopeptidase [Clostridium]KAA8669545.1 GPR endopeptidase [Clostridium sp. HV4-5-A1G]MCC9294209.1 GPR endopeptidase [Clostridium aromativorans]CAB1240474.1 spore germination protease [Clostridiaceae bacterium BL-3]